MDTVLEKIKQFADNAHGDQTRKYTPEKYIVHPVRVMETCREYDNRLEILAAALLHDVVEDTSTTNEEIVDFLQTLIPHTLSQKIGKIVEELTDIYIKADYPHLNRKERRLKEANRLQKVSADAQTIKYADIIDNSLDIMIHDPAFGRKYLKELKAILNLATKGNAELYRFANQIVDKGIVKLSQTK
ncbi:MAG TPA: HD domain-containing protein [Sphingobacterium sp.]|nr:HD domain-containing protein [Sphingobacterium sp.]